MLAYMITWTTYGSWLQGDNRGYVKNNQILPPNQSLYSANQNQQKSLTKKFNKLQREIIKSAIQKEAQRIDQEIYALAVCSNHIHLVLQKTEESIERSVARYKGNSTFALRSSGFEGKIWTRNYDKSFLYKPDQVESTIEYVKKHNNA